MANAKKQAAWLAISAQRGMLVEPERSDSTETTTIKSSYPIVQYFPA